MILNFAVATATGFHQQVISEQTQHSLVVNHSTSLTTLAYREDRFTSQSIIQSQASSSQSANFFRSPMMLGIAGVGMVGLFGLAVFGFVSLPLLLLAMMLMTLLLLNYEHDIFGFRGSSLNRQEDIEDHYADMIQDSMSANSQSRNYPIVDGHRTGVVSGDPEFFGFEGNGEYFNIRGQANRIYNLLSDRDVQVNGRFVPGIGEETLVGDVGIKVRNHRIQFNERGNPTVNGVQLTRGSMVTLDGGECVTWDGSRLLVVTREYTFRVSQNRLQVRTSRGGVFQDGVMPHGLLGQTADLDNVPRINRTTYQGEGVIDGTYRNYEVPDLFSNNFMFNRNIHN